MSYTREGRKILEDSHGSLSSRQAIERVYNVRQSLATAEPYSASLLAYGEVFGYSQGVLYYVHGPFVRLLDIHSSSEKEEVVDLLAIEQTLAYRSEPPPLRLSQSQITSLSYSDRTLVCVCEGEVDGVCCLLVIDLDYHDTTNSSNIGMKRHRPFLHQLRCKTKLFVRHNRSYLYYGTHSGVRSDRHHEWLLTCLDIDTERPITQKPFRLADFVGSDIGCTASFQIHEGHFYAISNQTSFEVEEIDWTSYYHIIKIPLGETKPDLKAYPLWQRQHGEGPINDSWTDLSIQKDEQTNELLIVECRKEWLGGGSANIRTYYTQPLCSSKEDEILQISKFPENDSLSKTLTEDSKSHFSEPRKRIRKHYHREYEESRTDPRNSSSRDYILAKTKFRAYNASAMSFMDLVSDPAPLPRSLRIRDRLRLRIASRKPKSPLVDDPQNPGHCLLRQPELDEDGVPLEGSEEDFNPTEFYIWPPDDAPQEIYDLLCPSDRVGNIDAVADERSIIYAIDAPPGSSGGGSRAIVMISFDPTWGCKPRNLTMPKMPQSGREMKLELPHPFSSSYRAPKRSSPPPSPEAAASSSRANPLQQHSKRQKTEAGPSTRGVTGKQQQRRLIYKEEAMYISINRRYRLR